MKMYLSEREIEFLQDKKAFIRRYGNNYAYSVKHRIIKKYKEMEETMRFIQRHIDAKTLKKLICNK